MGVGPADIGDRHGHLARILGHDSGPRQEAMPSMEDEHLRVFVDIPGLNRPSPPQGKDPRPLHRLPLHYAASSYFTVGGRLSA
jgi:hypothetical protein